MPHAMRHVVRHVMRHVVRVEVRGEVRGEVRSRGLRAPACLRRRSAPHRSSRSVQLRIRLHHRRNSSQSRPSRPTIHLRHPRGGSGIASLRTEASSPSRRQPTETTPGRQGPSCFVGLHGPPAVRLRSRAKRSSSRVPAAPASASALRSPCRRRTARVAAISSRSGWIAPMPPRLRTSPCRWRARSISSSARFARSEDGAMPRGWRSAHRATMPARTNANRGSGTQGASPSSPASQAPFQTTQRRDGLRSP